MVLKILDPTTEKPDKKSGGFQSHYHPHSGIQIPIVIYFEGPAKMIYYTKGRRDYRMTLKSTISRPHDRYNVPNVRYQKLNDGRR